MVLFLTRCDRGPVALRKAAWCRHRASNLPFPAGEFEYSHGLVPVKTLRVKLFFTGPVIKTELLVVMLERHGIAATQEFIDPSAPDDGDLNREARVLVPEADYDRAYQLFYAEREDEL